MNRSEFTALPLSIALGLVFDATPGLANATAPRAPLPPKYDEVSYRKDSKWVWCSEMTLADLRWHMDRSTRSAAEGGQYAEKDRARADKLSRWVNWREAFPTECWVGERGRQKVTAVAPSRDPQMHTGDPRSWVPGASAHVADAASAPPGDDDPDSIPF